MEWTVEDVLNSLSRQVLRAKEIEYEDSRMAEPTSRSFIAIFENWNINCSQVELNLAKQAILPLWQESQFEKCYVYPSLYPHDL
jgi:hypothetical protein